MQWCLTNLIQASLQRCSWEKLFWKYAANLHLGEMHFALRHGCSPVNLLHILQQHYSLHFDSQLLLFLKILRARIHETRSELKPVWNLKPLWNVVPFTWQFHCEQHRNLKLLSKIVPFTRRFHCGNFPNHSNTLLHMCKWYLLINANSINAKQMLCYSLFFKQYEQNTRALVINFNDSVQIYFTAGIYCLHGKLKNYMEKFAPKWVSLRPKSCEH